MPLWTHDALPLEAIMKILLFNSVGLAFIAILLLASLLGHDTCVDLLDAMIE